MKFVETNLIIKKPTWEYTLSAPTFGVFPNILMEKIPKELVKEAINSYGDIMQKVIHSSCKNFNPIISIMYNAFTEEDKLKFFDYYEYQKCGFQNLYADSGGLQIVTRHLEMTEALKDQIYHTQMRSDYAMCFDEIRLTRDTIAQTRNERSQAQNKIFQQGQHKEAGFETGKNIKNQIETFKRNNAKTKVIVILQGNKRNHMLDFYGEIEKQLTLEDYDHIGGFAVADTCIGSGQLQVIEMLRAARQISHVAHPNFYNHLHLLGIGSIPRLSPAIFLKKSGYLDKIDYISYDSSKISQSFMVGAAILDGKINRLGDLKSIESDKHFRNVYDMFSDYFKSKNFSKDQFLGLIFREGEKWSNAKVTQWARETGDELKIALSYVLKTAHVYFQIVNYHTCIDDLLDDNPSPNSFKLKKQYAVLNSLKDVNDEVSMQQWLTLQKQSNGITDSQIRCEEDIKVVKGALKAFDEVVIQPPKPIKKSKSTSTKIPFLS